MKKLFIAAALIAGVMFVGFDSKADNAQIFQQYVDNIVASFDNIKEATITQPFISEEDLQILIKAAKAKLESENIQMTDLQIANMLGVIGGMQGSSIKIANEMKKAFNK